MSARALPLVFFPLAVMILGMLMNASAIPSTSTSQTAAICAQQNNCTPGAGSQGTLYICNPANALGSLQACKVLPSCSAPPYPSPLFCIGDVFSATGAGCLLQWLAQGAAGCGVYLWAGGSAFVPTAQIQSSLTNQAAFFAYTTAGVSGFITMIGLATGIISLLGLTVFGSGEQGEGLHILFEGGMVLGLWLVMSGLEGYAGSGQDVFFSSFNVALAGAGTFLYVMLTLSVVGGFLGLVSRGA